MDFDYDVLIVGSGFGGSTTALRLTEKGYKGGILESRPGRTPACPRSVAFRGANLNKGTNIARNRGDFG